MAQISIIVEFETEDGREEEFTALMMDHARRTLSEESGCLRFDVVKMLDADGVPVPNGVMVVELYADRKALASHRDNPRMGLLRGAYTPMLRTRRLFTGEVLTVSAEDSGLTPDELNASNDG